jgi:hypothetical protein
MLGTYIYHLLSPTCFVIRYSVFRETVALLAQELCAWCNVVTLASTPQQRNNTTTGTGSSSDLSHHYGPKHSWIQ